MAHKLLRTAFGIVALTLGLTAAEATPLTVTKSFGAASIPVGGITTLTFVITNPDATPHTNVAMVDVFPAGMVRSDIAVINSPGCIGGGVAAALDRLDVITGLAGNGSCTLTINITATTNGTKVNTSGPVTSTEGGTGGTATATLKVNAPPTVDTSFLAGNVALGQPTGLNFTLTNPAGNPDTLTGISFATVLPAGLQVPNASAGICGGTVTLTNPTSIAMTGALMAPGSACIFTVPVDTVVAGSYAVNTTVSSTEGGAAPVSTANLNVEVPPAITKAFGAAMVPLNGTTSLTFTVQDFTSAPATNVTFTDTLPAGLVVATPNGVTGSCGVGTIIAAQGSSSVSLLSGNVAANSSCTFSINVRATTPGTKNNTTGAVTSTGGTGGTASAQINVAAPASIAKAFGAAVIPLNGVTSLTVTITNPNAGVGLTGVGFTDTFPAGLVVATPNGLSNTCGGVATATAGSSSVSLAGASLGASASCTFSVDVVGTTAGVKNNTTGAVTSSGGTGGTASAQINVAASASIAKAFGAASIALNGVTSLTLTVTNPNAGFGLTGVGFTDTFPAGLVVATPNGLSNTCGGVATATAGSSSVSLAGASLGGAGSCTFTVDVMGTTAGTKNNTTGVVSSTEGGPGNTASASVMVVWNSFTGPTPSNGNATVSFTGGAAGCTFTRAAFIPLSGGAGSPPAGSAPAAWAFPDGLLDFATTGCGLGATLNFTVTYATALSANPRYWKYGPTPGNATPTWYMLPATITGNTATFSITDGGLGDDGGVDGDIVDQGGPAIPAPGGLSANPVPTLSEWALLMLALLFLLTAGFGRRRR